MRSMPTRIQMISRTRQMMLTKMPRAAETGYIKAEDLEVLKEWRKDPANWKK